MRCYLFYHYLFINKTSCLCNVCVAHQHISGAQLSKKKKKRAIALNIPHVYLFLTVSLFDTKTTCFVWESTLGCKQRDGFKKWKSVFLLLLLFFFGRVPFNIVDCLVGP